MKEQLITKDTAKLAEKLKFDWKHSDFYIDKKGNGDLTDLPCVPQSLIQKWLRDIHNIHVIPYIMTVIDSKKYTFTVLQPKPDGLNGCYEILSSNKEFDKYEDALEIGIQESLKYLINNE